jgi:hypothetical protein
LPLASQAFEEKNEFEFEKDYGIDTAATRGSVAILHQFPDEGKVKPLLQAAVEVVFGEELFERDVIGEWLEIALLRNPSWRCWLLPERIWRTILPINRSQHSIPGPKGHANFNRLAS